MITDEAAQMLTSTALTAVDRRVILEWAERVRRHGPSVLAEDSDTWADHPLYGEWRGYRASRFSHSGRIVYRVEEHVVTVAVVRITPNHDYRRPR